MKFEPTLTYVGEFVDTELAKRLLASQEIKNRNISARLVQKYARDMAHGKWQPNGETIKLDPDGRLIDGQHRLTAVIEAASRNPAFTGITLDVVYGVTAEALPTLDTGRKRSLRDVVVMHGGTGVTVPIVKRHLQWLHGNYVGGNVYWVPTEAEGFAHYQSMPELFETTGLRGQDARRAGRGAPTPNGLAYHVLRVNYGDDAAERFFGPYVSGAGLREGSPILALHRRVATTKLSTEEHVALIMRAWNHFQADKTVQTILLKYKLNNANFPQPVAPGSVLGEDEGSDD